MTKIIPVNPVQNIYASKPGFRHVATQDVLFNGRTVQKLTYRDAHSLIWKIGQVAIAALLTLISLGIAFCFQKGIIWRKALAQFKYRIVYQNIATQLTPPAVLPLSKSLLDICRKTPAPIPVSIPGPKPALAITPISSSIVPFTLPPPAPTVAPAAPLSPADIALQLKKESLLKENPEYGNAVMAWEKTSVSLSDQFVRLEELRQYAFGVDKWVKYFGEIVGIVPPLPEDIYEICHRNDHSKPGEKVKDTHVLVLVPEAVMVKGKRFVITLESLEQLVPKGGGHETQYGHFYAKGHENTPGAKSHWTLMKKEVIPGSRNQTFGRQIEIVNEYSKRAKVQYSVPNAIDVVACCFMNFVNSGNRLFDRTGQNGVTFTRCQELIGEKDPIVVGGFDPRGLFVHISISDGDSYGVGAMRKF